MIPFDELFDRHDPFHSFTTAISDSASSRECSSPTTLTGLRGLPHEEIHQRLTAPEHGMDLRPLLVDCLHRRALLVDAAETYSLALVRLVELLETQEEPAELDSWALQCCFEAIDAAVENEAERERSCVPVPTPTPDHMACLRSVLNASDERLRLGVVSVNALPDDSRRAFVGMFLLGKAPGALSQELGKPLPTLLGLVERAILALQAQGIER